MDNEDKSVSIKANQEQKDDTSIARYKCFFYFKDHPAFFVTVVSCWLAAITFLCNFLNSVIIRVYLQKWNIDTTVLGPAIKSGTLYYFAVFSLVYFFVFSILSYKTKSLYSEYFSDLVVLKYYRELNKVSRRQLRKLKSKLKHSKRKLRRIRSSDDKELRIIENEINKEDKLLQKMQQSIHDLRKALAKGIAWKLVAASLLLCVPSTLQQLSFGKISFLGLIVTWIIYSLTFIVIARSFSKKDFREYSHKRIVSDVNKAENENNLSAFCSTISQSISMKKTQKKDIKDRFSDENIPNLLFEAFSGLFFMTVSVLATGIILLNSSNGFYTYHSDEKSYAVIYQNENVFYLEEAAEVDGTLIIDTSSQRIIKADDLSIVYKKYKKVIKSDGVEEQEINSDPEF